MKIYKYFLSFVFFIVGLIVSNELYIDTVEFETGLKYPSIDIVFREDNCKQISCDIAELSKKYGVAAYINSSYSSKEYEITQEYFITDGSEDRIRQALGITEEYIFSIGSGNNKYVFKSITDEYSRLRNTRSITLLGNDDSTSAFIDEFLLRYPDGKLTDGRKLSFADSYGAVLLIFWSVLILTLAFINLFEISAMRKQVTVELTLGRAVGRTVIRNLLTDFAVYATELLIILLAMSKLGFARCIWLHGIIAACAVMAFALIINITLYFTDFKASLGDVISGKRILRCNYILKFIMLCVALISFALFVRELDTNTPGMETRDDLKTYFSDYYYSDIVNADIRYNSVPDDYNFKGKIFEIYVNEYDSFKPLCLSGNFTSQENEGYYPEVKANRYAINYLTSVIDELKDVNFSENNYLIVPEGTDEEIVAKYERILERDVPDEKLNVIVYKGNVSIMCLEAPNETNVGYLENPVIMLENHSAEYLKTNEVLSDFNALLLDEESINSLCEKYKLSKEVLNATKAIDKYDYRWRVVKSKMLSTGILSLFMILMELVVTTTVLRIFFSLYAKELSVKRILGYRKITRYFGCYMLNALLTVLSFCVAVWYVKTDAMENYILPIGVCVVIFFIIDTIITSIYTRKIENKGIPRILKGDAL